jgi:hypothetical protein
MVAQEFKRLGVKPTREQFAAEIQRFMQGGQ